MNGASCERRLHKQSVSTQNIALIFAQLKSHFAKKQTSYQPGFANPQIPETADLEKWTSLILWTARDSSFSHQLIPFQDFQQGTRSPGFTKLPHWLPKQTHLFPGRLLDLQAVPCVHRGSDGSRKTHGMQQAFHGFIQNPKQGWLHHEAS